MWNGSAGAAILASLLLARVLAAADANAVRVAGREMPVLCISRLLFGVNCPGCGMTRSVLMTLGGDLRGALALNPGGPLLVAALILLGAQLVFAAARRSEPRRLLTCASTYGVVVASAMLLHWAGGLFRV